MSTVGGMEIATTGSDHVCPGPTPAMSLIPPTPPAGLVPSPFAYISKSSSASQTSDKLKVNNKPVLVKGSVMTIEQPGNVPANPPGAGDVVTHVVDAQTTTFTGSSSVIAEGKGVCCTGDKARMNVPMPNGMVSQAIGTLVTAGMLRAAANPSAFAAGDMVVLDPISAASGAVVDDNEDLALPGAFPLVVRRMYSSARNKERGLLGVGGWILSFEQRITKEGDALLLRDVDGKPVKLAPPARGERTFHRGKRLWLRASAGSWYVTSVDDRLTRVFSQLVEGGTIAVLQRIEDAYGHGVELRWEGVRLVEVIDTAGRSIVLSYDDDGRVTEMRVAGTEYAVRYAYLPSGELGSATDPCEATEAYVYDAHHRLVRKTIASGVSFHYEYDAETGRCVRARGDGGLYPGRLEYDLEKGTTTITDTPEPRVIAWRKEDGAIVGEKTPDGAYSRQTTYDADLLVVEEKNAAGATATYQRDAHGNVVVYTDAGGWSVECVFDDRDLLIERRADGLVTKYDYDANGGLVAVHYPSGVSVRLDYDRQGRVAAIHAPDGVRARFEYDDQHNVVREITARGGIRAWRYDALGRPIEFRDPIGRVLKRVLDGKGRPIEVQLPDGAVTRFSYDRLGRQVRAIDPLGRAIDRTFVGTRSPHVEQLPDGRTFTFAVDGFERLQSVKNPKGETFEFRYDRAGNVREHRAYDGRITRFLRAKNHKVARVENPDGTWASYVYDGGNNVLAEQSPHGAVVFERDELGRPLTVTLDDPQAGPVVVAFEYDTFGRVVTETQNGKAIRYEYDNRNRCIARHLPTGQVTRYEHDADGDVTAIVHGEVRVAIERDLATREVRRTITRDGRGVDVRFAWDPCDRIVREWVGAIEPGVAEPRSLVDRTLSYNAAGWVEAIDDARGHAQRYRYDAAGLLVAARHRLPNGVKEHVEQFAYDAASSLEEVFEEAPHAPWAIAEGNVLLRSSFAEYEYDAGKRRRKEWRRDEAGKRVPGPPKEYLWDARGRLREVVFPDGRRIVLTYDPFARLARKEVFPALPAISVEGAEKGEAPVVPPSRTVEYLWDGRNLAAEIDSERGVRVFVHQPRTMVPLLLEQRGKVFLYVNDHGGQPRDLVDVDGALAWSAIPSAWGTRIVEEKPADVSPPQRLLGQYWDDDVELAYNFYRWFDPSTARFLSPDPIGLAGGDNLHQFNGAPTVNLDPVGLACIIIGDPRVDAAMRYMIDHSVRVPGMYEVYVHGTATNVAVNEGGGHWANMTPQQLQDRIRAAGNYADGTPLYMNSCNTGRTPDGVAQQMSQGMGTTVVAPNDVVWGQGQTIAPAVGSPDNGQYLPSGTPRPDMSRQGQWNWWDNGTGRPGNAYRPTS